MGRPRKNPEEIVKSISINLKQKIITEIAKEGKPKHIIEEMVKSKYKYLENVDKKNSDK